MPGYVGAVSPTRGDWPTEAQILILKRYQPLRFKINNDPLVRDRVVGNHHIARRDLNLVTNRHSAPLHRWIGVANQIKGDSTFAADAITGISPYNIVSLRQIIQAQDNVRIGGIKSFLQIFSSQQLINIASAGQQSYILALDEIVKGFFTYRQTVFARGQPFGCHPLIDGKGEILVPKGIVSAYLDIVSQKAERLVQEWRTIKHVGLKRDRAQFESREGNDCGRAFLELIQARGDIQVSSAPTRYG